METITVFTGMEVHGAVEMQVLKTFANGEKLCFFNHNNDDDDLAWDELWIAQPDDRYGWYGVDSQDVRVEFGNFGYEYGFNHKSRFES